MFFPLGRVADVHHRHLLESVDVGGIGHDTHLEVGRVATAAAFCPESQLQISYLIYRSVDTRKRHTLIVTVCACSSGIIPIQTPATTSCMVIRSAAAYVWIPKILAAIVQAEPAIDKSGGGAAARSSGLEIVHIRQTVKIAAGSTLGKHTSP